MGKTISVIMGIYNCADTLPESLDSLLAQTYSNWNVVMCDDGSTDETYEVALAYCSKYPGKFILMRNEHNMGLNYTLNRCLMCATGEYIARMDGDDISLPERFEKEAAFLDSNPQFDIVSTPMIYFDENGDWGRGTAVEYPQAKDFIPGTPFCHAPCMVRAAAIRAVGGYSTEKRTLRAEDYDLWFRMYANGSVGCNLSEPYYKMRDDQNAYHRRKYRYCLNEAYVRAKGYHMLGLPARSYLYALRPLLVGLLPKPIYLFLHKKRQQRR